MEDTDHTNKPQSPQEFLQEQLTNASTLFESSLSAASDALKKSTASAKSEADRAAGLLQVGLALVKGVPCTPIVRDNFNHVRVSVQTSYDHTIQGLHQLDDIIMSSMKGVLLDALFLGISTGWLVSV
jgi:hypothetical protein